MQGVTIDTSLYEQGPKSEFARDVVARLRSSGYKALWAGGCVRDLVLGLLPADYDVATDASAHDVMGLFPRTVPVGISFGVVRVLGARGAGEVEVATFRTEGEYLDGRRPASVHMGTPEEDAARRDFTINGMFLDPFTHEVIDYVGGMKDLELRVVRAIGDPWHRFAEDKLRLIRAVRFAARFGFVLESTTRAAIQTMAAQLGVVAVERIAQELRRMLIHPTRAEAMRLAMELGLMSAFLPELEHLNDRSGSAAALWTHTMAVLASLCPGQLPTFPLGMAALLTEVESSAKDGAHVIDVCRRLRLSNAEAERIEWLVAQRQALWDVLEARPSARKRLLMHPGVPELIELHRAIGRAHGRDTAVLHALEEYRRDEPEGPIDPPPLVTGEDLKRLGIAPGPRFKELLERVRDAQLDGVVTTREAAVDLLRNLLEE